LKIVIIDNNDSFSYNLVELVRKVTNKRPDIVLINEVKLEKLIKYDKIILSPGPDIPKPNDNMSKILDRFKSEKSILGVCLGCQAIAQFFGASLYNLPKIVHGMKRRTEIKDKSDNLFKEMNNSFDVGLYHSWTISKYSMPSELKVTSLSEEGIIMSISHKHYDIKGIQFHPESYMTQNGYLLMRNFLIK